MASYEAADGFSCELKPTKFSSYDEMAQWFLDMLQATLPHTSAEFQEKIEQGAKRYAVEHSAHIAPGSRLIDDTASWWTMTYLR